MTVIKIPFWPTRRQNTKTYVTIDIPFQRSSTSDNWNNLRMYNWLTAVRCWSTPIRMWTWNIIPCIYPPECFTSSFRSIGVVSRKKTDHIIDYFHRFPTKMLKNDPQATHTDPNVWAHYEVLGQNFPILLNGSESRMNFLNKNNKPKISCQTPPYTLNCLGELPRILWYIDFWFEKLRKRVSFSI